ncbi:hypothetical protein OBBRIDRAFT_557727 [Obba rivulosa]|uniref:Uncharacterized protein n=1 Tax=Obba rivulosa TaxID=1052685 RepID=A0A8E2DDC2_9APHY|nr:hypothetical protein OBBRIDRAFT_557727 [Obba rivulosa]
MHSRLPLGYSGISESSRPSVRARGLGYGTVPDDGQPWVECHRVCANDSDLSNSTISAIGSDGCSATVFFNASSTTSGEDQSDQLYAYGVSQTDRTTCGFEPSLDIGLQPAAFWFYNRDSSTGASIAQMVICRPQIDVFNVIASVWPNNDTLLGVQQDVQYTAANNVTGPTQNGLAFNAYVLSA